jgi:hypothetical protein
MFHRTQENTSERTYEKRGVADEDKNRRRRGASSSQSENTQAPRRDLRCAVIHASAYAWVPVRTSGGREDEVKTRPRQTNNDIEPSRSATLRSAFRTSLFQTENVFYHRDAVLGVYKPAI